MASAFKESPKKDDLKPLGSETRERFLDLQFKLNNTLHPIEGYQNAPLLPIEDSLARVKDQLHELQSHIRLAKHNCRPPIPDGLKLDESVAIRLYTMEWDPREKCLYYVFNQCLRNLDREKLKPWFAYLKLLMTALYRLPARPQLVYRGVKDDLSRQYRLDTRVVWWAFSSCTTSLQVLESDQYLGQHGVRTLFNIECLSGRDISQHSNYESEGEVLLLPGRQFKVVGTLKPSRDLSIIHLKEEVPSEPLIAVPFSLPEISSSDSFCPPSTRCPNKELYGVLRERPSNLEAIDMNISDDDMRYVIQYVRSNERCVYIDLSSNAFSETIVCGIEAMIRDNGHIETLILSNNHLCDVHVEVIVRALRHHNTLVELTLANNDITDIGLHCIVQFLQQNESLRCLNLNFNKISDSGLSELSDVLSRLQFLQELYLSYNEITDVSTAAVIHMLERNHSLVRLDLDNNRFTENDKTRLRQEALAKRRLTFGA